MKVHVLQWGIQQFRGSASREDWWVTMLGAVMLALILYFGKILFDGVLPGYARWSAAVVFAFCATAWVPVSVRRLRDLGVSRWWVVLGWVPVANLVLLALLGTRKAMSIAMPVSTGEGRLEERPETLSSGRRGLASRASDNDRS